MLRDSAGDIIQGAGKRPDIQYIAGGKINVIELQSLGQSKDYMKNMGNVYQSILGPQFGTYGSFEKNCNI
jgi:hypothetical protein